MKLKRTIIKKKNEQINRMAELAIDVSKDLILANKAITDLSEALRDMLVVIAQTDWKNGVTDNSGSMDEGEVLIGRVVDNAKTVLARYKGE